MDPTSGKLYLFKLSDNMFTVVGGFNESIGDFARGGWTDDVIDGDLVRIIGSTRARLYELDGGTGASAWLDVDGDANDSQRQFAYPLIGSRTEYTLQVYNSSDKYAQVCHELLPFQRLFLNCTWRCCAISRMPITRRLRARLPSSPLQTTSTFSCDDPVKHCTCMTRVRKSSSGD